MIDTPSMAESIEHSGHTIVLIRGQADWRVYIRPPRTPMIRAQFAKALSREQVIAEAKRIIDGGIAVRA